MAQIHELIGKAMNEIGAIGKDSNATDKSGRVQYKFRGIDAVYNALNPVMAKLGLFICPEIIDQQREERTTQSGGLLKYTLLTVKYTVFAPDGSNVSMTVVGEGMDSGDKSSNKAMSVAMKYAMFQLFMIPTEDLYDSDKDVYTDVQPNNTAPQHNSTPTTVSTMNRMPSNKAQEQTPAPAEEPKADPTPEPTPVQAFLLKSMRDLREARRITVSQNNKLFAQQFKALVEANMAPNKKLEEYNLEEAEALIDAMYKNFSPEGTEIKK